MSEIENNEEMRVDDGIHDIPLSSVISVSPTTKRSASPSPVKKTPLHATTKKLILTQLESKKTGVMKLEQNRPTTKVIEANSTTAQDSDR